MVCPDGTVRSILVCYSSVSQINFYSGMPSDSAANVVFYKGIVHISHISPNENDVKSNSISITWLLTIWQEVFMVFISKGFAPQTKTLRCDCQEANVNSILVYHCRLFSHLPLTKLF